MFDSGHSVHSSINFGFIIAFSRLVVSRMAQVLLLVLVLILMYDLVQLFQPHPRKTLLPTTKALSFLVRCGSVGNQRFALFLLFHLPDLGEHNLLEDGALGSFAKTSLLV